MIRVINGWRYTEPPVKYRCAHCKLWSAFSKCENCGRDVSGR